MTPIPQRQHGKKERKKEGRTSLSERKGKGIAFRQCLRIPPPQEGTEVTHLPTCRTGVNFSAFSPSYLIFLFPPSSFFYASHTPCRRFFSLP